MRRGIERSCHTFSLHNVSRRPHRTWDDPDNTRTGRCRAFAMNDDLCFRSIGQAVSFAPREIVMVLDVEHHVHAQVPGDAFFPKLDFSEWKLVAEERHPADDRHAYPFSFLTYDRRRGALSFENRDTF